jgi:SAM-dependent methyltransferase
MSSRSPTVRTPDTEAQNERDRVHGVYKAYESNPYYKKIWSSGPASQFRHARKWEGIAEVLRLEGVHSGVSRILDLGAGGGWDCARFRDLGLSEGEIFALDLLIRYARQARLSHPAMKALVADAAALPFPDGSFDLVYQSTMLSSVLREDRRNSIFEEIRRVLAPGGIFLSYDVRYPNPRNPNTRPVRASRFAAAFPGWRLRLRSITALPPLVRLLAPVSIAACRVAEAIPPLRSHLVAIARKPRGAPTLSAP